MYKRLKRSFEMSVYKEDESIIHGTAEVLNTKRSNWSCTGDCKGL